MALFDRLRELKRSFLTEVDGILGGEENPGKRLEILADIYEFVDEIEKELRWRQGILLKDLHK